MATRFSCDRCQRDHLSASDVGRMEAKTPSPMEWFEGDLCKNCCADLWEWYTAFAPKMRKEA